MHKFAAGGQERGKSTRCSLGRCDTGIQDMLRATNCQDRDQGLRRAGHTRGIQASRRPLEQVITRKLMPWQVAEGDVLVLVAGYEAEVVLA